MAYNKSEYRADVDGLRAIAILGVLIFHIWPEWAGGGYVGVDVFFVISGFLITRIIARDLDEGKFSFAGFYERRIRRIVPALFVMIFVVAILGGIYLFPANFEAMGNSVSRVVTGIANFFFMKETGGYFSRDALDIPFLHTWSLSVEEQFYFVFPLLMWALHRYVKTAKWRITILLLIFASSLAISIHLVPEHALTAFYLPHARIWELLLGSLIGLLGISIPAGKNLWSHVVGLLGLLLVIGSMVHFSPHTPFPGAMALFPCVGTALLLVAGARSRHAAGRLLELKPMVFIGRISYSVYLWHWPLLSLFHDHYAHVPGISAWIFLGSLVLGWLSWRWIERPFRNLAFLSRRQVYLIWLLLSAALIIGSIIIRRTDGLPQRFSPQVLHYLTYGKERRRFHNAAAERYDAAHPQVYGNKAVPPTLAIWGDSHAEALMPLMEDMAKSSSTAIAFYGTRANPPIPGAAYLTDPNAPKEEKYKQAVIQQLLGDQNLKTVIFVCRWTSAYLGTNERVNTRKLGFYGTVLPTKDAVRDYYFSRIRETIDVLRAGGKRVVLVYPIPEVGFDVPVYLARKAHSGATVSSTIPFPGYRQRHKDLLAMFDQLPEDANLVKIRVEDKFIQNDRLTLLVNDEALYQDDDHLSKAGAFFLRDLFAEVFRSN